MKILIDNGHGVNTPGKCSPDKSVLEYKYCREIASAIVDRLKKQGYDIELLTPEAADVSIGQRVARVNAWCDRLGSKNVVLVSVHLNAAGGDGKWHDARGFSVFVSKNASEKSKDLASMFTDFAKTQGLLGNRSVPKEKYWTWSWTTSDIGILKQSKCPAVLTENMFQDNKEDVGFLLSPEGREKLISLHVETVKKYVAKYGKK